MAQVSLKPSQKGVTVLIIVAAATFVCCLLACLGTVQKIKTVDKEKAAVEKQVRESQTLAQTQRVSENKYLDTRAQIRCLEESVSDQAYVPTLLKQIEHLGKSVKLKVIGVRPKVEPNSSRAKKQSASEQSAEAGKSGQSGQPTATAKKAEPAKPYDELQVELQLEGNYMNALDFLYRLTSFPKIMAVNSVQMNPTTGCALSESPQLNIQINVTAFIFKEVPPITKKPAVGTAQASRRSENEAG